MKTAIIILGHGSKSMTSDQALRRIAEEVKQLGKYEIVEHAFLQYTAPTPQDILKHCVDKKVERIVMVPFFMQEGTHVTKDIPDLVDDVQKHYPGIEVVVTDYVGTHPLMAKIVDDLITDRNHN